MRRYIKLSYIKDELLEPYFIECEEFSYNVKLNTGKTRFDKKLNKEVVILENKGYFANKLGAFNKIKDLKMNDSDLTYSIKEYFEESNKIIREFITKLGE